MDTQVKYGKLIYRASELNDKRVIKYIDKPDPIIEGMLSMLKRKVIELIKVRS